MRIRRLTVKNFGKFENFAVDFNGNLAVINGQNEAGKSTIFDMIKMLLFGLGDTATADERMSYVKYGANEAHISGEFERADKSPLTLSRIISKHSCDLNINENFDFQNLGDTKAPIAADLSKEVYENIYALDFHAMSAIKDDIWQGIKEEFMGADMAKELVSATQAIDFTQSRAEDLHKKGSAPSVIGELSKARDNFKEKLEEINEDQRKAAGDYLNLDKTKREITDMQNKIEFESAFMQEAGKMNGLKEDVARIKELANEAGDLSEYKQWLPNIKEEYMALKQLEEDAKQALEAAGSEKPEEPEAVAKEEIPSKYEKALELEQEIRALQFKEKPEEILPEVPVVQEKEPEPIKSTKEWDKLKEEILTDGANQEDIFSSLDQINAMSLAEKLGLYNQSKDNLNNMIQESAQPKRSGVRTFFFIFSLVFSILFILSGVSLFFTDSIGGLISNFPPVYDGFYSFVNIFTLLPFSKMITADILCGAGLILGIVAFAFIKGKSPKVQLRNREEIVRLAREESEYNRGEFEKQLFGLPIRKIRIKKADTSITEDIRKLKEARQKLFESEREYTRFEEPQAEEVEVVSPIDFDDEINNLAKLLLDFPSDSAEENLSSLNNLLDNALQYKSTAEEKTEDAFEKIEASPEVDLSEFEDKYQKAKDNLYALESLLGDEPEGGIDSVQERYSKLNRAVVLRDEILEKHPNFKEISERLNQLERSGWPYKEDAVSKAQERIGALREEIGDAQSKIGVMENSVKKALLGHDPAEIASEVLKMDSKIINSKLEYDKMRLSEIIIKQGHDTFSKLHQPEVLQRASYYLSILTDGKYSELDLSNETSEITVMLPDGRYMTPQGARLSQATREQIYLSIRLSVIESFDEGKETMPITLDEALITWDKDRLTAGLDLLAQIARKRQILIFTCHDFIVDTMKENQPTAQIIELK